MKKYESLRKLIALTVTVALALSLTACKKKEPAVEPEDEPGQEEAVDPNNSTGEETQTGGDSENSLPTEVDLSESISLLPDQAAINEVWSALNGFWISEDGRYIGFVTIGETRSLVYGKLGEDSQGYAELDAAESSGVATMTITVVYPAMPATATAPSRPSTELGLMIDAGNLPTNSTLRINIMNEENAGYITYTYAGSTFEDTQK